MLFDIQPAATASNSTIVLHPNDNIAVARVALSEGQTLEISGAELAVRQNVPAGHKVATRAIASGSPVYRYGEIIGFASVEIEPGDHVHVHNLAFAELDHHNLPAYSETTRPHGNRQQAFSAIAGRTGA